MSVALPENTAFGYSYEYGVEIYDDAAKKYVPIRFISDVNPSVSPVTKSAPTYEDKGAPNETKTSESWELSFYVQHHYTPDGQLLPELKLLRDATMPEAVGNAAVRQFLWYDKPDGTRKPDLEECFSGHGTVSLTRAATSADGEVAGWNVTVTGKGRRTRAKHPATPTEAA
ncbi:phage tail tube protein [Actinotignum sp. GS-2025e]|uniref:phage tail tube protein n=1 Tax=unclassified Actinotignum TaxID=2632702 RepID=UPI003F45A052